MTTLHDELVLLSNDAPRADSTRLTRTAVVAATARRRRLAAGWGLVAVAVSGSILLHHGVSRRETGDMAGSARPPATLPATAHGSPSLPSSRPEITALVIGAVLGVLLAGIGARLRREDERVSPVERVLAGVWGATAGGWVVSVVRLLRDMYRAGTLTTGHQEGPVLAACAVSLAIATGLMLGTGTLRRLSVVAAAAIAVMEVGGAVRPLADMGYWFDSGYWLAVWPEPLLAIRTAVGLAGLVWLLFAPLGKRGSSPWWLVGGGYVLVAAGAADLMPHLTPYSYDGETWAALLAAAVAGVVGIALTTYLRRALHPASAVVAVAALVAYASPFVTSPGFSHGSLLEQAWRWLPGAVSVLGVVLLPVMVWAWTVRQDASEERSTT